MKQLLVFIKKEFFHVFRDRRTLLILFGLPVTQIILYGFALTSEVKNVDVVVVDYAKDAASQQITGAIQASLYFNMQPAVMSYEAMQKAFRKNSIRCAVIFPANFNKDLLHTNTAQVQIIADASDPNTAKTLVNYLSAIITEYQQQLNENSKMPYRITTSQRMLYNPQMNGSMNFIPGVIALIFMIVCTTLTSVSIVREKENGTMEVLLVSPFKPVLVLVAKAIPYLVLSLINFIVIISLSVWVLHMPVRGNLALLVAESMLFVITCLSLGLLISNVTTSQQSAMLFSMMGMMLPTLLFTGFIFPIENMPLPLQAISHIVPARWYYLIVKAVMLKGLGFKYVWKETLVLIAMAGILLTISLKKFKIRLA